jgi:hypothetical protein
MLHFARDEWSREEYNFQNAHQRDSPFVRRDLDQPHRHSSEEWVFLDSETHWVLSPARCIFERSHCETTFKVVLDNQTNSKGRDRRSHRVRVGSPQSEQIQKQEGNQPERRQQAQTPSGHCIIGKSSICVPRRTLYWNGSCCLKESVGTNQEIVGDWWMCHFDNSFDARSRTAFFNPRHHDSRGTEVHWVSARLETKILICK